jgi:hypothetical protein
LVPLDLSEAADDLLSFISRPETRFGTGWSIDDSCGQVGTGELALMWARSGSGKSTWMLNIIANTPRIPTVVFNMEMTPRRQLEWLAAMTYSKLPVPARDLESVLRAGPDDDRYDEVARSVKNTFQAYSQVHFVNPSMPGIEDLMMVVDDITDKSGVRPTRVFIDHLTLLSDTQDYSGVVRTAAKLHSTALREDIAIFCLQQTGRGGGGQQERNNGHLPVTMNDGVYGGEADADWIFGLYRPDRNPKFSWREERFKSRADYLQMLADRESVRGLTVMQVIKNRPFGDVNESGIELWYDSHTRRLEELGAR